MSNTNNIEEIKIEEVEKIEETPKPYTIRNVKGTDIFLFLKLIKKIGIRNFKEAFLEKDKRTRTFLLLDLVFDRISECETEVNEILSKLSGMEAKEVANQDADVYMAMIYDVIESPKFEDFIRVALRSLR